MNRFELLLAVAAGGFGLGVLFFGGLWLTVRKSLFSRRPWLWFLLSMVLRTALTLAGFLLMTGGHLDRLLACLAGFAAAKLLMIRHCRPADGASRKEGKPCI
jgi:F1F0 ATPase subunit 2